MAGFSLSDDLTILALAGTWSLVIATIFLMWWQTRQAQRLHSANAVMALRERFDSPDFRAARRRTARYLLSDSTQGLPDLQVAAFFELMGALAHEDVLDRKLVWSAFGGWITGYLFALRHPIDRLAIAREATHDPLLFGEFEWLANFVITTDKKALGEEAYAKLPSPPDEARTVMTRDAALETFQITTPTPVAAE